MFEFSGVTSFLLFTLVITVIVRVFYSLVVKNWNYFSERNVEFKRGLPLLGTMYPTMLGKESMAISSLNLYQKYSDRKFVGMYEIGGTPSFMVIDPDLIRDITIKDFDYFVNHYFQLDKKLDPLLGRTLFSMSNQSWRDMRTTMSPLFTGSKMRHMLTLMIEKVRDFNAYIRDDITSKTRTNGREYNTMDLMMRLTNDIISSCAFGLDTNTLKEPENEFYKMGKEIAYAIMGVKALFLLAFPKVAAWLGLKILNDQHDNFFRTVIHNTIEERQKKNIVRNDMLNLLLLAKEGKLHDQNDNESDQDTGFATISEMITAKTTQKLKNWTDDDLVAQCVIFFLAGFTGVSTTFCFLCYELSLNPDIQGRLYDEITETNEQLNGKPLTFEALQRMKYLDMVVSEVLRKWPVGTMMDRAVSKQYLMEDNDGTKVLLQPNNVLWIPVFGIQRNPKFYPKPDTFDPNRFNDDNKKNIHPSTYLPFGSGPQ